MGADSLVRLNLRVLYTISSYSPSPSVWSAEGRMDSLHPSQQHSVVTADQRGTQGHMGTFWVTVINPATCWHPILKTSYSIWADGSEICEGRAILARRVCVKTSSFNASQDEFEVCAAATAQCLVYNRP